jgi:hypothetical protein
MLMPEFPCCSGEVHVAQLVSGMLSRVWTMLMHCACTLQEVSASHRAGTVCAGLVTAELGSELCWSQLLSRCTTSCYRSATLTPSDGLIVHLLCRLWRTTLRRGHDAWC